MGNFLRDYIPNATLWQWGSLSIHWYGIMYLVALTAALAVIAFRKRKFLEVNWTWDQTIDFVLIVFVAGLAGARIYEVLFVNPVFYFSNPGEIIKVWEGGLAIHGGILAGALAAWWKAGKDKFLAVADWFSPALLLGQAIGRWGNWFNQELFGLSTNKQWGIPIDLQHRPFGYEGFSYFHPAFLYEFLWNVIGVALLAIIEPLLARKGKGAVFAYYLAWYSVGRFCIEFIRIDNTPAWLGLRLPQWVSLVVIVLAIGWLWRMKNTKPSLYSEG
ncbi:MAG: prolipoprotein diacylglyceryl transferase [bacterium]